MKQHTIQLSAREQKTLRALIKRGTVNARVMKRAQVLLQSHAGKTDEAIAKDIDATIRTVERIRKRYVKKGLKTTLYDAPRPGAEPVFDEKQEARLVAIACSTPPEEATRWTIELLRDRLLKDRVVQSVSVGTIHARLTERGIKPWLKKNVVHSEG